jgi:SSS family solute:Na+ symporter
VGEFGYGYGLSSWVLNGVPYYLFAAGFALFLSNKARTMQVSTIPEQLGQTYGAKAGYIGALYTSVLASPAPYLLMIGILMEVVTGWSLWTCLLVSVGASMIYMLHGGFVADRQTDVWFALLMFFGFGMMAFFIWKNIGSPAYVLGQLPASHVSWHGGNSPQFMAIWFLIASWTLVDPGFYQRCYAAKNEMVAKKGILWSILCWFIFDMLTLYAALSARVALPDMAEPVMAFPLLAEHVLPPVAKGLFFVSMLATILSTLNSQFFISATSLGRDFLYTMLRPTRLTEKQWIQASMLLAGVASLWMCLRIPSVLQFWYTLGTLMIPGLLLPLLSTFWTQTRIPVFWLLTSMLLGSGVSLVCLLIGWSDTLGAYDQYPFGVEPMFPGFVVSLVLFLIGKWQLCQNRQKSDFHS